MDGRLLTARPNATRLGFVGDVSAVDPSIIRPLVDNGHIPVFASVAADGSGYPSIDLSLSVVSSFSNRPFNPVPSLPEKKKPLYSHSLPCIEAWLRSLGFRQSGDDRAVWFVEKIEWHAQLSLEVTDLYIRYLKIGPGNLDKDVERRFSYAPSREDIENAILGGL